MALGTARDQGNSVTRGFPGGSVVKNPPVVQGTQVQSLGGDDPLEEGTATHSSILAWGIPWTEEPGGLQSLTQLSTPEPGAIPRGH